MRGGRDLSWGDNVSCRNVLHEQNEFGDKDVLDLGKSFKGC